MGTQLLNYIIILRLHSKFGTDRNYYIIYQCKRTFIYYLLHAPIHQFTHFLFLNNDSTNINYHVIFFSPGNRFFYSDDFGFD